MKPTLGIFILMAVLWMQPCVASADDSAIDFSCVARRADQQTKSSQEKATNGGSITVTETKEDWQYVVTLQNKDPFKSLDNIEVKYIIFFKQEELGALASARLGRQGGSAKIDSIKQNDKAEFRTVSVTLQKAALGGGAYFTNGAKTDANANLAGLWIRIYQNGNLIAEMSRPPNLLSKEKWEE